MQTIESIPLISVIVPIYDVAPYLRKCLGSLKGQTLKQIEIICIDDGSTDESGKIADEYVSNEWPVFRCIHTENRGLSAARNRGIDESRAEWLMFVDSDDWVEPEFCEVPYEAAIKTNSDIIVFGSYTERGNRRISHRPQTLGRMTSFIKAVEECGVVAWNKAYRRKVFINIRYPERRVYEDVAVTHKLLHEAKNINVIQECLYHHRYRNNSISKTSTTANLKDGFISATERYKDFVRYGYDEEETKYAMYSYAIGYLARTLPCDDENYLNAKELISSIEKMPKCLSIKKRIAVKAWKTDNRLFYLLCKITHRI